MTSVPVHASYNKLIAVVYGVGARSSFDVTRSGVCICKDLVYYNM